MGDAGWTLGWGRGYRSGSGRTSSMLPMRVEVVLAAAMRRPPSSIGHATTITPYVKRGAGRGSNSRQPLTRR